MPTYKEALLWAVEQLTEANVEGPRLDAEVLLIHVAAISRASLYSRWEEPLSEDTWQYYKQVLQVRTEGRPVAYITGNREFMSLEFQVNEQVLIPRPETEILVEFVINQVQNQSRIEIPRLVDVGTGSGAIAVSLAKYLPLAKLWAVDMSQGALEVAKGNALVNGVEGQVTFVHGDLLSALLPELAGQLNWVVANLPYIPSEQIPGLQKEVERYEPHTALDGGPDGLDLYRRLIPQAEKVLKNGGWLGMEMAFDQGEALVGLLNPECWTEIQIIKDYAGLDRHVVARYR